MWGLVMASGHATAIGGVPEHVPIGNGLLRPPLASYSLLLANCGLLVMAVAGYRWPGSAAAGQAGAAGGRRGDGVGEGCFKACCFPTK